MIKTIVFDFGKVICHFDHARASRRLAELTTVPEARIFRVLYGGELEDAYESGRIDTAEFLRQVRDRCELRCSEDQLIDAYADIFWPNDPVCRLLPGLARSHRLLLLSNTNELHARKFLPQLKEPLSHFHKLFLSHEVRFRKPRREIYEHAHAHAECGMEECVFIDDVAANAEGARAFGWNALVYQSAEGLQRDLASLGVRLD